MIFRLNPANGVPMYLQLMEQVRNAVEMGTMQEGDQMPGIRTLAEQLVVSHNTVAKAYTELEHEGLLELRHGAGAFIAVPRKMRAAMARQVELQAARKRVRGTVEALLEEGVTAEEIRRLVEAQLAESGKGVKR